MAPSLAQATLSGSSVTVEQLVRDPRTARALDWLAKNLDWITEQQIRITEIPAPSFQEAARAAYLRKLLEASGLKIRLDAAGNLIGERPGSDTKGVVLISAHVDTVFPLGTEVHVRREGRRLFAPGISDNGAGLAALVAVARALNDSKLRTRLSIVFAADVGEEGEGNLRGMRNLVEAYRDRLRYVLVLDGPSTQHITTMALASRRIEVSVDGPGGHSWSDFGAPNPIAALARGAVRFLKVRVPDEPRTSFNLGVIEGGTSVNSIPFHAALKVDLRSESEAELNRLEAALRDAFQDGLEQETSAARARSGKLEINFRILGVRPGGELAENSPLLEAIRGADHYLGNRSRLERSSTDANIALSMGIPAIAIGGGGQGGGAHSPEEWYEPTGRELGLKRILLTLVAVSGVER